MQESAPNTSVLLPHEFYQEQGIPERNSRRFWIEKALTLESRAAKSLHSMILQVFSNFSDSMREWSHQPQIPRRGSLAGGEGFQPHGVGICSQGSLNPTRFSSAQLKQQFPTVPRCFVGGKRGIARLGCDPTPQCPTEQQSHVPRSSKGT